MRHLHLLVCAALLLAHAAHAQQTGTTPGTTQTGTTPPSGTGSINGPATGAVNNPTTGAVNNPVPQRDGTAGTTPGGGGTGVGPGGGGNGVAPPR